MTTMADWSFGIHPRDASPGGQGNRGHAATACPGCGGGSEWESVPDLKSRSAGSRPAAAGGCARSCPSSRASNRGPTARVPARAGAADLPSEPAVCPPLPRSVEGRNPVRWRSSTRPAPRCAASASFGLQACPRPRIFAVCTLCLACGHATAQYSKPARGLVEAPAGGTSGRRRAPPSSGCATASTDRFRCFGRTGGAVTNGESLPRGRRHDRDAEAPLAADANLRAVGRARRLARGVVRRRPVLVPDHPRLVLRAGAARVQPELHAVLGDPRRLSRRRLRCVLVLARDGGTRPGARRLRLLVACRDPTG